MQDEITRAMEEARRNRMSVDGWRATSVTGESRRTDLDGRGLQTEGPAAELRRAMCKLQSEISEGLEHGFFELLVSCEVIKGGKRRLTIRAGKSYQFVISEEELKTHPR